MQFLHEAHELETNSLGYVHPSTCFFCETFQQILMKFNIGLYTKSWSLRSPGMWRSILWQMKTTIFG
jgi:hypothetical protein